LSAGVLASAVAAHGLAAVPSRLAKATAHGAVRFALGRALTAGSISAILAREYLNGLLRAKVVTGAAAVGLTIGILLMVWWFASGPGAPAERGDARPGEPASPAPRDERERFQGDWKFERLELAGIVSRPETTRMTFNAGQCKILDAAGKDLPMTFQVDPTQEPKTIDLEYFIGPDKLIGRGIYRLEGDRLWICYRFDSPERPPERPSQFVTHPNTKEMLFFLQRAQADPLQGPDNPMK
jgi:uncharacterized protein (TIGR03067 family)